MLWKLRERRYWSPQQLSLAYAPLHTINSLRPCAFAAEPTPKHGTEGVLRRDQAALYGKAALYDKA
jgi:hypothetical protein